MKSTTNTFTSGIYFRHVCAIECSTRIVPSSSIICDFHFKEMWEPKNKIYEKKINEEALHCI